MKKDDIITIRVSAEYKQILRRAADIDDRSLSYYVNQLIENEVRRLMADDRIRQHIDDNVKK